jgi:hypothetical protein
MKTLTAVTTVGITAVALSLTLVGCGSVTKTEAQTPTRTTTTTSQAAPTAPAEAAGPNKTIQDYITENQIVETPIRRGDPGSPTIDLPIPPGWSDAGPSTPDWAYSAMVYDQPQVPDDPPRITAIVFKLTGNVDPEQILAYAPGELRNLPGFEPLTSGNRNPLSGFDAAQLSGNYMKDGAKRVIGRNTVVIPGKDGLYVLQMTADARADELNTLLDAITNVIDPQTTITP